METIGTYLFFSLSSARWLTSMRDILRALHHSAERARFRSAAVHIFRSWRAHGGERLSPLGDEIAFYLRSQTWQNELNLRYFPQQELTERERVVKTAARVGFTAPEAHLSTPEQRHRGWCE